MFRNWLTATVIAATTAVGVTAAAPSAAAAPPSDPCDLPGIAQPMSDHPLSAVSARALVQHLAIAAPYGAVRAAATIALNSPRGDVAIAEFLPAGWCDATRRAERGANMNDHIIQRILATHSYATSPWVYSAAEEARRGTPSEKETFVRHGLEEARAADQRARDADGSHAAALRQLDRDYVATLRDSAQGEQVRVAAAWAIREGGTDSDIVEFYTYAWARFAKLDHERFQLQTAEQEMRWLTSMQRLRRDALLAQAAAEEASGEAQKAMKEKAADAWGKVAAEAAPSVDSWQEAAATADAQAKHWQAVYLMALKQPGPNWKAMTKPSRANRDAWERDIRQAEDRAAFWQQVVADARAAEEVQRPTGV